MAPPPAPLRRALVTGAAQGIGRAFAERLAADGRDVVAVDLAFGDGEPGGVAHEICDVSDPVAVQRLRERVGHVDILVNNAGVFPVVAWDDLTFEVWRRTMAVNLDGAFLMCKAFTPGMAERGWGRVVNLASSSIGTTVTHFTHYISSKLGVVGLTRALASELGPRGVTVNAIAPSLVETPATLGRTASPGGLTPEQEFAALRDVQVVKRSSVPADLTGALAFAVGEESGFLTGQTLYVDGGVVRS